MGPLKSVVPPLQRRCLKVPDNADRTKLSRVTTYKEILQRCRLSLALLASLCFSQSTDIINYLFRRILWTGFAVQTGEVTYNISNIFQTQLSWNCLHKLETTCSTPRMCGQKMNTSKRHFWARMASQFLYD